MEAAFFSFYFAANIVIGAVVMRASYVQVRLGTEP
jgi:hypothetical protein